jgi:hypothetical protein
MNPIPFFNTNDFDLLKKFSGQSKAKENTEMLTVYNDLKETYLKIEYWAEKVLEKVFPEGQLGIRKKPTNQANIFQYYLWAKLYPDDYSFDLNKLAFTLGINTDNEFDIKIDTVGLVDSNVKRQEYLKERGDFKKSLIVKTFQAGDILSKDWDYLIDLSVKSVNELKPDFNRIMIKLFNKPIAQIQNGPGISKYPLNTILFGPPGTGKTYHTIARAISIANTGFSFVDAAKKEKPRKDIKDEYNRLLNEGQIAFTSFHQSMSYEDFIEGIKPVKSEKNEQLNYEIKDGIFKIINKRARSNFEQSKEDNKNLASFEDVFQRLKDDWEENPDMKFQVKTKGYDFSIIGFTDTSIHFKKSNGGTGHTLSINTLMEQYYGKKINFKGGVGTYYPGVLAKLKSYTIETSSAKKEGETLKNYVLIIDEINRGNISQIFGELITLIEDDKRLGKSEELSAMLPYSKESFSVAPNLYIVGTMNTADRSVEALDTALRRRFSFEFMPPQYDEVEEELEDVPLRQIFTQINERIAFLLDPDHQIGHSYFMTVKDLEDLKDVFRNKIIPLLKEYFFNDDRKIYLILGEGFVKKINYLPRFPVKDNEEMARDVYRLVPIDENFNILDALNKTLVKN